MLEARRLRDVEEENVERVKLEIKQLRDVEEEERVVRERVRERVRSQFLDLDLLLV